MHDLFKPVPYLLLVVLRLLQLAFGVVDESVQELTHTLGAEALALGHPQWA